MANEMIMLALIHRFDTKPKGEETQNMSLYQREKPASEEIKASPSWTYCEKFQYLFIRKSEAIIECRDLAWLFNSRQTNTVDFFADTST